MNAMQILSSQPWVERLGWTLIHFLWQGLSIALLFAAARWAMRRALSPNARYLLACAALAAMMASPVVTWEWMRAPEPDPDAAYRILQAPSAASSIELPPSVRANVPTMQPVRFLHWVVMFWLAGALVFWVRLTAGWMVAARMRSISVRPATAEWQQTLKKLGARIGVSRPVRLLVSALVQAPTVVGWLRPVVLAPVGALGGLPAGQIEALLLHELAHIRRHDYLVNLLQSVAEALLFYHPALWWVSGHIRAERELCCDDVAVSVSGDALTYARALAQLESHRPSLPGPAVAANGGSLAGRIARLLGRERPDVRAGLGPSGIAVTILLAAAAYGLFGQSGARPAFQSVSIRRNTSDWSQRDRHPMGMGVNSSLRLMIQFAYAPHENPMLGHSMPLPASLVVGGPAWIDSEGYDIDAKPGPDTDPKQFWIMWQTLLADRFQLRLHRETRELPIYNLTAAGSGLRLPAAKAADCVSFPPGTTPRHIPGKVDCGYVAGPFGGHTTGLLHIQGRKVHVADLTRELASVLERPVYDRTGYSGEFDLDLSYASGDANPPNLFAALEQQLGLKLEPATGPVEVLVIDHAERPASN